MNKILKIIIIVIFLFFIISTIAVRVIQGQTNEITVALNKGELSTGNYALEIKEVIDGYRWVVNNIEYVFNASFIDIDDVLNGELIPANYKVHIIDGVTDEQFECVGWPFSKEDNASNLRSLLDKYITSGGGYIGRCGGALSAGTYFEEEPTNMFEYYIIKQNEFLGESAPEIKIQSKIGGPLISKYFEMHYGIFNNYPFPRKQSEWDPGILGVAAYYYYTPLSNSSTNSKYSIHGISHNVTKLYEEHPILSDYHGDRLYLTSMATGSFVEIPEGVDVLGYYPDEIWETDPDQDLHVWNNIPTKCDTIHAILNFINYILSVGPDGVDLHDLLKETVSPLPVWYKTFDIIETEMPGKAAIISFNNGNGRVVLSGPHPAANVTPDAILVENTNTQPLSWNDGLYHWELANGTWLDKTNPNHYYINTDLWWYWKVNVSDGSTYVESDEYKFYTGNQSKIKNVGSTNISGYLLIQVQFYNDTLEDWVVASDTVNKTVMRTIGVGEILALDIIFNGNVDTSDLLSSFGCGTYRVYAAFRNPDGDVLIYDDESLLEATYEFTINYD